MGINLRSLAYLTDLSILSFEGRVEDCGDYYLAETPDNPGYFWGNLLVMKKSPTAGDLARWTELFKTRFSHQPLVKHMTFGWDSPEGDPGEIEPFKAAGFDVEKSVILTATRSDIRLPAKMNYEVEVRPLKSDSDWEAAIQNQVTCRREDFKADMYLPFKRKQMAKYRRMAEARLGNWYGAFLKEQLVAECGLFSFDGIGRYQAVGTHPEFRRRGICGTLIYHSAKAALEKDARTLVMAADSEYHAARVYQSVGFRETEKSVGAYKWPKEEWSTVPEFREARPEDMQRMKFIRDSVKENRLVSAKIEIPDYQKALFEEGKGWVCIVNGQVVGFSCGRLKQKDVWALFLDSAHEGRGIGGRLMDLLESWMFANGCSEIILSTTPKTRAEHLYRKRGWEETGILTNGEVAFKLQSKRV